MSKPLTYEPQIRALAGERAVEKGVHAPVDLFAQSSASEVVGPVIDATYLKPREGGRIPGSSPSTAVAAVIAVATNSGLRE